MRLLITLLIFLSLAGPVHAACTGRDLLPELKAEDPAGVAGIFERAHAQPNAQGRFWRIEKPGIAPSHLLGTFHTEDALETVSDAMWQTLDGARIAIFEMDLEEKAALEKRIATDPNFSFDTALPPLLDLLNDRQRAVLTKAFADRGLPPQAANHMRPWLLAGLLGFPACQIRAAQQGAEPMDLAMARRMEAAGKPVEGLEPYQEALAGLSQLDRDALISALVADPDLANLEEDIFKTHASLYAAGETLAINELGIWLAEREQVGFDVRALNTQLMQGILDVRNRTWLPRMLPHLDGGNAFVAVGALHLPGQAGVIELLRAEGFTVSRLD